MNGTEIVTLQHLQPVHNAKVEADKAAIRRQLEILRRTRLGIALFAWFLAVPGVLYVTTPDWLAWYSVMLVVRWALLTERTYEGMK